MLLIFGAVAFVWLLGIVAVCTFCIAAARADRVTNREFGLDEESAGPLPCQPSAIATSTQRPAA